jgi:hypothetical protein
LHDFGGNLGRVFVAGGWTHESTKGRNAPSEKDEIDARLHVQAMNMIHTWIMSDTKRKRRSTHKVRLWSGRAVSNVAEQLLAARLSA